MENLKLLDFSLLQQALVKERELILNKISGLALVDALGAPDGRDEAEVASQDACFDMSLHLQARDRAQLYRINKALSKIEDGGFGQCESCGETIDVRRLLARPYADLCLDCSEEYERCYRRTSSLG